MATLTKTGALSYALVLTQAEQDTLDKFVARPRGLMEPIADAAGLMQLRLQSVLNEVAQRVDEFAADDLRQLFRNATLVQRAAALAALRG